MQESHFLSSLQALYPTSSFSPFSAEFLLLLSSASLLQPRSRGQGGGLDGSSPCTTHLRPLNLGRRGSQRGGVTLEAEIKQHCINSPPWPPTGSTSCDTWPSSPAPCTLLPLTPCAATRPLTFWPAATSSAASGQIFPKRWRHCVSSTIYSFFSFSEHFGENIFVKLAAQESQEAL